MANTHRRWTGELAKPLRTRVGLLAHLDPADKSVALAHAEIRSKLDLLLDEYAIPRGGSDKWFHLSCALAEEFVPGFRHTQRGRAVKWGMFERGMLVVELERLRKEDPSLSITAAAKRLAGRPPWKQNLSEWLNSSTGPDRAEALRKMYNAARKDKFAKAARDAYQYRKATGSLQEWDALVKSCFGK